MEVHLVEESIKFMILGMGIVFVFLYILVLLMRLQAWIIERFFPEKSSRQKAAPALKADDEEGARVAAIVAAVAEYRKARAGKA
ncbi:OadG family protein [Nitratifractor salsuginis]|uniref:Probable oxaloacetate decarboxylase gamma chain n=1 Tax=Nitratifractor salsuginis (strain DSM 16511 / JCM 12458 / E9I37-1) TaxID=749222 RepID=E6WYJ8_NITSE|nr:OadG family transporter subunit [Nitratifractor salsuginis]ADV46510.1 sodium pump decarboxylase, gamma subunit [Nitratifractor salsuginis DSM 16511]